MIQRQWQTLMCSTNTLRKAVWTQNHTKSMAWSGACPMKSMGVKLMRMRMRVRMVQLCVEVLLPTKWVSARQCRWLAWCCVISNCTHWLSFHARFSNSGQRWFWRRPDTVPWCIMALVSATLLSQTSERHRSSWRLTEWSPHAKTDYRSSIRSNGIVSYLTRHTTFETNGPMSTAGLSSSRLTYVGSLREHRYKTPSKICTVSVLSWGFRVNTILTLKTWKPSLVPSSWNEPRNRLDFNYLRCAPRW